MLCHLVDWVPSDGTQRRESIQVQRCKSHLRADLRPAVGVTSVGFGLAAGLAVISIHLDGRQQAPPWVSRVLVRAESIPECESAGYTLQTLLSEWTDHVSRSALFFLRHAVVFVRCVAQSECSKHTRMKHEKRGRNQNMPVLWHVCHRM